MRRGLAVGAVLIVLVTLLPAASAAEPASRAIKVHYTPQDRAAGRFQYVPFDVPPGTTRVTCTLAASETSAGSRPSAMRNTSLWKRAPS